MAQVCQIPDKFARHHALGLGYKVSRWRRVMLSQVPEGFGNGQGYIGGSRC